MNLLHGTATLTIDGIEYKVDGNFKICQEVPISRPEYAIRWDIPHSISCKLRMSVHQQRRFDRWMRTFGFFDASRHESKRGPNIERSARMRRLRRLKYAYGSR